MDDKVLRGIMISLLHGGHYEILADLGALKVSEVNFYPSWLNMFNAFYLLVGQEGALGSFGYGIFLLKWEAKELQ